ncbi:hypothetical protein [Chryseobacterium bernardetii]|uniref:hypothetical protein n=1 Tax=Chryseobacterium bernardetii TaxID=1241978 RepID=UPI00162A8C09|nr:hypothetical protein [Chryseobacterium bernardetii]
MVKLAKAFGVSVDFILGEGLDAAYDKEMVKRLDEVESFPEDKKNGYSIIWISLSEIIKLRRIINKKLPRFCEGAFFTHFFGISSVL